MVNYLVLSLTCYMSLNSKFIYNHKNIKISTKESSIKPV